LHYLAVHNSRGGIKRGVLLGFRYGNRLKDTDGYLTHDTNNQIFYKIYRTVEETNEKALRKLLKEAVGIDKNWRLARIHNNGKLSITIVPSFSLLSI